MSAAAAHSPQKAAGLASLAAVRGRMAVKVATAETAAGRTWREIDPAVRTALVMLALEAGPDSRTYARQAWSTYTPDVQITLGAIARTFAKALAGADALR